MRRRGLEPPRGNPPTRPSITSWPVASFRELADVPCLLGFRAPLGTLGRIGRTQLLSRCCHGCCHALAPRPALRRLAMRGRGSWRSPKPYAALPRTTPGEATLSTKAALVAAAAHAIWVHGQGVPPARVRALRPMTKPMTEPMTCGHGLAPGSPCYCAPLPPAACVTTPSPRCDSMSWSSSPLGWLSISRGNPGPAAVQGT